jgi:hypothetical protein
MRLNLKKYCVIYGMVYVVWQSKNMIIIFDLWSYLYALQKKK